MKKIICLIIICSFVLLTSLTFAGDKTPTPRILETDKGPVLFPHASHDFCKGCHKEQKQGPTKCEGCHKK